jgi:hypothetical protein
VTQRLKLVQEAGVTIVHGFPPECVPILRGKVMGSLAVMFSNC